MTRPSVPLLALALFASIAATPSKAALILNQTGINEGFTLTTFLSGYNAQYGPLAQGVLPNGQIITGSLLGTKIYVFNDFDGQMLANAVSATSYSCTTGNCNFAMATAGGQVYGAQAQGGIYLHFNSDGSSTPIPNLQAAGLTSNLGMWGNPVNGHLVSSSSRGLVDIDPVAGTFRVINAGVSADGVTVSPDGTVAYVEVAGGIQEYNIATGALLRSFVTGHSPDGTGVISGGSLNGDVIVNNNDGTVGLLDPSKPNGDPNLFVIIATGGTRGDFVSPDLNNGTLFLSQNEQVARLSCGAGCSIGGPPPEGTPEPSTLFSMGAGLCVLLLSLRRKG
jgi:PEP-CTERM motif